MCSMGGMVFVSWNVAYLQVPVVHGAAAVGRLGRLLTGVEEATQLTEKPGSRYNELHPCQNAAIGENEFQNATRTNCPTTLQ